MAAIRFGRSDGRKKHVSSLLVLTVVVVASCQRVAALRCFECMPTSNNNYCRERHEASGVPEAAWLRDCDDEDSYCLSATGRLIFDDDKGDTKKISLSWPKREKFVYKMCSSSADVLSNAEDENDSERDNCVYKQDAQKQFGARLLKEFKQSSAENIRKLQVESVCRCDMRKCNGSTSMNSSKNNLFIFGLVLLVLVSKTFR